MTLELISAPVRTLRSQHEHIDLRTATARHQARQHSARHRHGAGTHRQRPARPGVPLRILRAHQLLPAAFRDADVRRSGRRGEHGRGTGDRRAAAWHRGRGACRTDPDAAVRVLVHAPDRGTAAGSAGPGAAARRLAGRHRDRQRRPRLRIRPLHRDDGRPHGGAAAARTARRRTRPVRGRGHRAGHCRAAGRCLARRPPRCPGSGCGVPMAVGTSRAPRCGNPPRHRAAGWAAERSSPGRATAALRDLRGQHRGGRRGRLLPSARRRGIRQRRGRWPVRAGSDRHDQPLVGGTPRGQERPRAPAGPGAGDRVPGHDHHDLAGLPGRRGRGHVPVRNRVRNLPERHLRADDRAHAPVRGRDGQRPVEPGV